MNSLVKFSVLSLGLVAAGCSGGGGGSTSSANVTPQPASILSSGSLAVDTRGESGFTATATNSQTQRVTVGGRTYTVTRSPIEPSISSNDNLILVESGFSGIRDGQHVATKFYFEGTNLQSRTGRVSDVGAAIIGDLTPEQNLPAFATYRGQWNGAVVDGTSVQNTGATRVGSFSATADFGPRQKVNGTFRDIDGLTAARLDADITGNQFSGSFSDQTSNTVGDIKGGFFGPNAEEIAGVGAVSDDDDKIAISFIGSR